MVVTRLPATDDTGVTHVCTALLLTRHVQALQTLTPQAQAVLRQDAKKFLDVLIQRELLYRESRAGLDADAEARARLDEQRRSESARATSC